MSAEVNRRDVCFFKIDLYKEICLFQLVVLKLKLLLRYHAYYRLIQVAKQVDPMKVAFERTDEETVQAVLRHPYQ